jgi:hypothetical protein
MSTFRQPQSLSAQEVEELRKERVLSMAMGEGLSWGIGAAAIGTAGIALLSYTNPRFQKLRISTKASIPTMMGLGAFSLNYELAVFRLKRNPDKEGLSTSDIKKGTVSVLPMHHRFANMMYDHPFGLIVGMGIPIAGFILNSQLKLKHITFSQRIMHSRVFAQGSILVMALSIMSFREWMDRRGRF